uniref:Uncharacterized protein n=1 Tax=Panagrolaimus sp. ES5 TaxID=591445 RepID=A0AC34GEV3_9BILA
MRESFAANDAMSPGMTTLPIGENGTIEKYKIATIIQFSKIFAKVKDDKTMEGKVTIPIEDIYYSNTEIIKEKKVLEVCPKFKGKHFNRHQRKKAADCIY